MIIKINTCLMFTAFVPLTELIVNLSEEKRQRWERLWMLPDRRDKVVHPLIYPHPVTKKPVRYILVVKRKVIITLQPFCLFVYIGITLSFCSSVQMSYNSNSSSMDEPILILLHTVAVFDPRMCTKEDKPRSNHLLTQF